MTDRDDVINRPFDANDIPGFAAGANAHNAPATRPVRFEFDDSPAFDGITDDSTWNGWLNVKVTPATRDAIVAHFDAQFAASIHGKYIGSRGSQYIAPDRDDWVGGIDTIPVGDDGLVDLGGGFATRETEEG